MKFVVLALFVLLFSNLASAQDCVPCDGKCLTPDQVEKLREAVKELKDIHESPTTIEFQDIIVIIRDLDGRVYVNGGFKKPLRLKVRIGKHVDRDVLATVESRIWYRPEPESPMFRLRIRAQAGILIPEMIKTISGDEKQFWDGGVGWDFFHIGDVNLAAFTGVRSAGIGPGVDITKNFGVHAGYAVVYDGFSSSALMTAYFSFN
jgi:ribosomal protein L31E